MDNEQDIIQKALFCIIGWCPLKMFKMALNPFCDETLHILSSKVTWEIGPSERLSPPHTKRFNFNTITNCGSSVNRCIGQSTLHLKSNSLD